MTTPLPAAQALERYFLDARCKILEVAAILDRVNRGEDSSTLEQDARLEKIRHALEVLLGPGPGRAERVQKVFSMEYDPAWIRPVPR